MNGLIAFFDTLGYQSFLENNSGEDSALKVFDLISKTPHRVKDEFLEYMRKIPNVGGEFAQTISGINHLVFSDTVLLSINYPVGAGASWRFAALTNLSVVAGELCADMFSEGLPMRGGVIEGEFFIKEGCVAGRAIVDAYKLCELLDFAGLVYSPTLVPQPPSPLDLKTFENHFIPYLSPLNNSKEQKLTHFNWVHCFDKTAKSDFLSDIEQFVHRAFWAHRKDCSLSADIKLRNTVKLCRRLAIALEAQREESSVG
jgi:hypothetical protein